MVSASTSPLLDALRDQTGADVLGATAAFGLVVVGVTSVGLLTIRALRLTTSDPFEALALVMGLGIAGYGLALFALGFAPLLTTGGLAAVTMALAIAAIPYRDRLRTLVFDGRRAVRTSLRREPLLGAVMSVIVVGALLAGFRPSEASDEVDYHFAAPQLWSDAGQWVTSPYRFTNGFHLAEILYTPSAVFDSATAAHWTHTLMLVMLAVATAALARRLGGGGALAAAAAIAAPTSIQSWWAYNDVFAAALMVTACLAAFRPGRRWILCAGLLAAAALSTKPILVFLIPGLALIVFRTNTDHSRQPASREMVEGLATLGLPVVVASVGWFAYTRHFAGTWFQRGGLVVASGSRAAGEKLATIRVPHPIDVAMIPFLPMLTAVIGNRAQYGGRTGIAIALAVPLIIVTTWRASGVWRARLLDVALPAATMYVIAAVLIERTRFLITVYALIAVGASVAMTWWLSRPSRAGQYMLWTFRIAIVVSAADLMRVAVR
jgi:hypothetical protein